MEVKSYCQLSRAQPSGAPRSPQDKSSPEAAAVPEARTMAAGKHALVLIEMAS